MKKATIAKKSTVNRQLKLFLAADGMYAFAFGMLGPIYAVFVADIGGDILQAGIAWSIFMMVSGIGLFFAGKLQDAFKNDKLFMIIGYSIRSLGFLGYYFVNNVAQMFLLQAFLGLAPIMMMPAAYSFYSRHVDQSRLASQWALWESIWYILQGAAAIVGSFLASIYGFKTLFLIMFGASLASLGLALKLVDEKR